MSHGHPPHKERPLGTCIECVAETAERERDELKVDLRAALDLLMAMLNEDGNINWNSKPLKGTVGWEIRQLVSKYEGKLAVHANKTCEECGGRGMVPAVGFEHVVGPLSVVPCPSCTEVKS